MKQIVLDRIKSIYQKIHRRTSRNCIFNRVLLPIKRMRSRPPTARDLLGQREREEQATRTLTMTALYTSVLKIQQPVTPVNLRKFGTILGKQLLREGHL